MRKSYVALMLAACLMGTVVTGCGAGSSETTEESVAVPSVAEADVEVAAEEPAGEAGKAALEDGVYTVEFDTDSGMFHVNEAMDGKGTLTVENGEMTVHISLVSKKIINLYPGLAEDAEKDGALLLKPTIDTVTYSDGMSEEVFGYDVPVPYLDEEFDLAIVGEKGTWYDHKVSVSDPVPAEGKAEAGDTAAEGKSLEDMGLSEGSYQLEVILEGGTGKATVESPAEIRVENGQCIAVIVWSSPYYDYMIVDGVEYQPVNEEGNSVFEIPVDTFGAPIEVQADTVAMSTPHLIDYTLTFGSEIK